MSRVFYISTDKNSRDTPTSTTYPSNTNLPLKRKLTPQTPTYPSNGKIGGGIIKLYQSRCFYFENCNPRHRNLFLIRIL